MRWFINLLLLVVVLFLMLVIAAPMVFSNRVAVVLTGSMGESMPPGSLAVSAAVTPEEVVVGDIITFVPSWDPEVTVSHRVIEVVTGDGGQPAFRTQGDANENPDNWVMPAENVTGKVVFHVPYLGNVARSALDYVRSVWGLILLVVIPSVLIVISTMLDMTRPRSLRYKRLATVLKRQPKWARQRYKKYLETA